MKHFYISNKDGVSTVTEDSERKGGLTEWWNSLDCGQKLIVINAGLCIISAVCYLFVNLIIYFGGR